MLLMFFMLYMYTFYFVRVCLLYSGTHSSVVILLDQVADICNTAIFSTAAAPL